MKKIKLDIVNETVYYEKLDNGLDVYVLKKNNFHSSFATFMTNFGGKDVEFIPINEDKMVKMPSGIAHFLEHKLFEQETGESVHDFYKKSGSYVNAMTGYKSTKYIFKGPNNFKENLNYLLDYVQSPYFTDQNVEKEKGIILEEARMDLDNPYRLFSEAVLKNLFKSSIYENTIIGSMDDIKSITKEDLYRCYNSFYHPSNMALLIVTNEDENEIIELVKNNQKNKQFKKDFKIIKKEYEETEKVRTKKEIIYGNVNETRVCYSLKFKLSYFNASKIEVLDYFTIFFDIVIGLLSSFNLKLKEDKIIKKDIDFNVLTEKVKDEEYVIFNLSTFTEKTNKFISLLKEQLLKKDYTKELFDLYKKTIISDMNYQFNSINGIMRFLTAEYEFYNKISNDIIKIESNLNYDRFKEITNKINTDNESIVIMKKNKKTML
ncbi:MAG: insulinase family protein [Bacilli bacterium]|nr:insulinase family protein [Bacilli bacterium]